MSINFQTKKNFIIELLKGLDGKFLNPRQIGQKYQEQFFDPEAIKLIEPAKHLHKELRYLAKAGIIQTWGEGTTIKYGIKKQVVAPIFLHNNFVTYYIQRATIPIDEWVNDPNRPLVKGIDFRIVQKLYGSLVHLLLYFSHPVKVKNYSSFGLVWIVKPKSLKFPKGKFECHTS